MRKLSRKEGIIFCYESGNQWSDSLTHHVRLLEGVTKPDPECPRVRETGAHSECRSPHEPRRAMWSHSLRPSGSPAELPEPPDWAQLKTITLQQSLGEERFNWIKLREHIDQQPRHSVIIFKCQLRPIKTWLDTSSLMDQRGEQLCPIFQIFSTSPAVTVRYWVLSTLQ